MAHLPHGRRLEGRRAQRPALWLVIALAPVVPSGFLVVATVLGAVLAVRGGLARTLWRRETRLVVFLAALGCLAQLVSQLILRPGPPLANPSGDGAPNLIANSDMSWLRGWTRTAGEGEYVTALEPGLWRIGAFDPMSGERYTEVRTLQEIPIAPGTTYTLSLLVKHDGTRFGGEVVFRTRHGQLRPGTQSEPLGDGVLRLNATLPAQAEAQRLRVLHLAELSGDWTQLDLGFAQLVEGDTVGVYRARSSMQPWYAGLVWWAGLAAALVLITPTALLALNVLGRDAVATGLLAGLGAQVAVALVQFTVSGGAVRVGGTLGDPNVLAHAALVTALAALALSPRPRRAIAAAGLALGAIALAGSHAGYGGVLLAGVGLVLIQPVGRRRRVAVGGIIVGVVAAAALIGPSWDSVLQDTNTLARAQIWGTAVDSAMQWPLTGVGYGNLRHFHEFALPEAPGPRYRADHAHSLLGLASEFGWPLAFAFLGCLLLVLQRLMTAGARAAALALAIALLLNLADLTLFYAAMFVPLWLMYYGSTESAGGPVERTT